MESSIHQSINTYICMYLTPSQWRSLYYTGPAPAHYRSMHPAVRHTIKPHAAHLSDLYISASPALKLCLVAQAQGRSCVLINARVLSFREEKVFPRRSTWWGRTG